MEAVLSGTRSSGGVWQSLVRSSRSGACSRGPSAVGGGVRAAGLRQPRPEKPCRSRSETVLGTVGYIWGPWKWWPSLDVLGVGC